MTMSPEAQNKPKTVMQEIIANDFGGNIPTNEEVIAKFPPKIESFKAKDEEYFRMVSRASDNTIIFVAPVGKV